MIPRAISAVPTTLLVLTVACNDATTAPPQIPAELKAVSPTAVTATVGTAVKDRPSVRVVDGTGAPIAGVRVTFQHDIGVDQVTQNVVTTGTDGIATVGAWTLRTTPGTAKLSANYGVLQVLFTAQVVAGPPNRLTKKRGDNQFAPPGSVLSTTPSVIVLDQYENPVSGVVVTFSVAAGGGRLIDPVAVSDKDGVARPTAWYVGDEGEQTLTATVAGLPALAFTATATNSPCASRPELSPSAPVNGDLDSSDCTLSDGRSVDSFTVTFANDRAYAVSEDTRGSFVPNLIMRDADGLPIAEAVGKSGNASFNVLALPGAYTVQATSQTAQESGHYTMSLTPVESSADCEPTFVMRGITSYQAITGSDCSMGGRESDRFHIYLTKGTKITVTVSTSMFDNDVAIFGASSERALAYESENIYNTLDTRVVFTAPTADYYLIVVESQYGGGAYTLIIE